MATEIKTTWTQIGGSVDLYTGMTLQLWAKLNSQDKTSNTSSVSAELRIVCASGTTANCYTHSCSFGGGTFDKSESVGSYYHGWSTGTAVILSQTKNIKHNNDGTITFNMSGSFSASNGLSGSISSTSCSLATIPRYFSKTPVLDISNITETSMHFTWTTSEICKKVILYYKKEGAATYSSETIYNNGTGTTTGTGDLANLDPNSIYYFYITCTRQDSSLDSNGDEKKQATYNWPTVQAIGVSDLEVGVPGTSITQVVSLNNPLNKTGVRVYIKKINRSGTQIAYLDNSAQTLNQLTFTIASNTFYDSSVLSASDLNCTLAYYCEYTENQTIHTTDVTLFGKCHTASDNCKPLPTGVPTYINKTNAALVGADVLVQNWSEVEITAPTITPRGGATLQSYVYQLGTQTPIVEPIEVNGQGQIVKGPKHTYSSVNDVGRVPVSVYAIDSRGYQSDPVTCYLIVEEYKLPNITINAVRIGGYDSTNGDVTISAGRTKLYKNLLFTVDSVTRGILNTDFSQGKRNTSTGAAEANDKWVRTTNAIPVTASKHYTASLNWVAQNGDVLFYNNNTFISSTKVDTIFETPSNCNKIHLQFNNEDGITPNNMGAPTILIAEDVNYWAGAYTGGQTPKLIKIEISPNTAHFAGNATTIGTVNAITAGSLGIENIAVNNIYEVICHIEDAICGATTSTVTINKAQPLIDINAKESAIGINTIVRDENSTFAPGLYTKNLYSLYDDKDTLNNKTIVESSTIRLGSSTRFSNIEMYSNMELTGSEKIEGDGLTLRNTVYNQNTDTYGESAKSFSVSGSQSAQFHGELYIGGPKSNVETQKGKIYLYNGQGYVPIIWYESANN